MSAAKPAPAAQNTDPARELAILAFNSRVLAQAQRRDLPLLERLRYVCIVSSNLDEFFEIRYSDAALDPARPMSAAALASISSAAHALVEAQYRVFNEEISPALVKAGLRVLTHKERSKKQQAWVTDYFKREVEPLLLPISLDPSHPFPQVANKSLNFIVQLEGKDAFGRSNPIAIVKVPRALPRVIRLPQSLSNCKASYVLLTSVIRANLQRLFPDRKVQGFSQFRITRDSDLEFEEREVRNLREALRTSLQQRNFGNAVRLEVARGCPENLAQFLLKQFALSPHALYRVDGPVNLVRLLQLIDSARDASLKSLLHKPHTPAWPQSLSPSRSIFEQLKHANVMLHHPFESFEPVLALVREAARDPDVLAIKQTIYRTGNDSELMELLMDAARRGKEVTVVVELQARFDEEANINWAEQLERVGAQVVYGVVGLKTHAKLLLITRREAGVAGVICRYSHLSTGNYNQKSAKLYTDVAMMSASPGLGLELDRVFTHLASQQRMPEMKLLCMAPFALHSRMQEEIARVVHAAKAKQDARIVLKMNALTDEALIKSLQHAAAQGVKISLIVRGACLIKPGANIEVRSLLGRFLEHSRLFYFRATGEERLWLASADWMSRNMFRRIEVAWRVEEPAARQRLIDECLVPYLLDSKEAWTMQDDGSYAEPSGTISAQASLMIRHQA
jgi:polyphosphate kinase